MCHKTASKVRLNFTSNEIFCLSSSSTKHRIWSLYFKLALGFFSFSRSSFIGKHSFLQIAAAYHLDVRVVSALRRTIMHYKCDFFTQSREGRWTGKEKGLIFPTMIDQNPRRREINAVDIPYAIDLLAKKVFAVYSENFICLHIDQRGLEEFKRRCFTPQTAKHCNIVSQLKSIVILKYPKRVNAILQCWPAPSLQPPYHTNTL